MYFDHVTYLDIDERLVIQGEQSIKGNHVTLLPAFGSNSDAFAILTDQALDEARVDFHCTCAIDMMDIVALLAKVLIH